MYTWHTSRWNGGSAANSGTIFHVLPTFNETSLTLANFEDRAQYSNMPTKPFALFPLHFYRL